MICREINVLSRFEYSVFCVLYPFLTYLLTLPFTIPTVRANLQSDHRCTRHKLVESNPTTRKGTTNPNWAQWNEYSAEKYCFNKNGDKNFPCIYSHFSIADWILSISILLEGGIVVFTDRLMNSSPACREVSVSSSCDAFHFSH